MGCVSSKKILCQNCKAPLRRSYSKHFRHQPEKSDDSHHMVAFSSSTLGSLMLDTSNRNHPLNQNHFIEDVIPIETGGINKEKVIKDVFKMEIIEAKTWSKMIDEKIPKVLAKTPTKTPPGEPEIINVWELMEGLEDTGPLRPHHLRSISVQVSHNPHLSRLDEQTTPRLKENGEASSITLWPNMTDNDSNSNLNSSTSSVHVPCNPIMSHLADQTMPKVKENNEASFIPLWPVMSDNESNSNSNSNSDDASITSEFGPEVISTFRKAFKDLPPANHYHLNSLDSDKEAAMAGKDQPLEVKDHEQKANVNSGENEIIAKWGTDKVIVYYTSLRSVRKTYEDCCQVRVILKGLGVKVDERDVSMHSGFREELKELLGDGFHGGLPRIFVGQKYIGGAEEVRLMNDEGQLQKVVESCELVEDGSRGGRIGVCEACGDIRFVPCESCSGSCKIYYEGDFEKEYDENEQEYGFHRCPDCNENGLVRCPICCD
ncbi:uncharacterized protein At5g39865-like isoform X1 [Olea europaea var. sylvestris]|uniref:uncharacterized protein At5g39865-like isoform X1 n=2 Tax=Olea europaea var. sylvestris TaxID=158386 RepID=UPI000C1CCFA0|nr:uncharacterized protein At5g39865-like isoform X1 [Olea europaea var. sylvestris]XP_022879600.1 uncharacterized protein At5g39865-like isoform X1 [Olea europaea var. sylvestris]